jgi:uncharacterized protein with GYD domain
MMGVRIREQGNDTSSTGEPRHHTAAWKETPMAQFMVQVAYTSEAWKMLIQNPQNRLEMVRPVLEELGGNLEDGWFAFGEYDLVAIVNLPDNTSAAAFSLAASAGGALKAIKTTPLMSIDEGVKAMRMAATSGYRPPSA